ncbi:MAG: HAD-IA family hydrolase [Ruminococcus sp.]|nr:HAD-IA family hydrolase [Ruminococcus sp.]
MLKAIIFDFDYTLGDSTNGIALSINYALEALGYAAADIADIKKTIGFSLKETYFALTSDHNLDKAEQFIKLFQEKADSVMVTNTELYVGVKDILQKLKAKGYKTAIVTTKFRYRIEEILSKFEANELIDMIVGAEDVKTEKPDPEGLLWVIGHLQAMKEEVLYVGDSLVDARTAENAQVKFAAVLTGTTTRDDFRSYKSVYIGENIADVCKYILTLS